MPNTAFQGPTSWAGSQMLTLCMSQPHKPHLEWTAMSLSFSVPC